MAEIPGAVIGAGVGLVILLGGANVVTHPNPAGSNMGGGSGGENFAENWIRQNNAHLLSERYAPKDENGNPRPLPTKDGNDTR